MTAESIRHLIVIGTLTFIGVMLLIADAFEPSLADWPHTSPRVAGWIALTVLLMALLYSLRKRKLHQIPGRLIHWKLLHTLLGATLLLVMAWHTLFTSGIGMQWLITITVLLLAFSGIYGIFRQAYLPHQMNKTLIDPVYKTALQEDVQALEEEINTLMQGRSARFFRIYQRHILPLLSIKRPDHDQQKNALKRLFGRADLGPNDAIHDVHRLTTEEQQIFAQIAEKTIDIIERRRCQAYQSLMNAWLLLHISLAIILTCFLFFHLLAAFYF